MRFGVRLYCAVGLVVDNVNQDHIIRDRRVNLTRSGVCNVVDYFGSKVDEPDQSRESVRSLNNPLGRLLANWVSNVRRLTESLACRLVF